MFPLTFLLTCNCLLISTAIVRYEISSNASEFRHLENLIGSFHFYSLNNANLMVHDAGLTSGQKKLLLRYRNVRLISSSFNISTPTIKIRSNQEFTVTNKNFQVRSNGNKLKYVDFILKRFRLAIVIPFISKQYDQLVHRLKSHDIYTPCRNRSDSIDLILYHNGKIASRLDQKIRQLNYNHRCYNTVRVFAAGLSKREDRYPSGSAYMWKKLLIDERKNSISLRSHGYTHFFLMEPDTRPIRSFWLDVIVQQILNGKQQDDFVTTPWWMIGSVYRGSEQIGKHFQHVNANALYHLSSNFIDFIQEVSAEFPFNSEKSLGYDLDIFSYLLKNIDHGKQYWHKFQWTDFIQNCWHTGCNDTDPDFRFNHPNTYLIHGGQTISRLPKKSLWLIILMIGISFLTFSILRFFQRCRKLILKRILYPLVFRLFYK